MKGAKTKLKGVAPMHSVKDNLALYLFIFEFNKNFTMQTLPCIVVCSPIVTTVQVFSEKWFGYVWKSVARVSLGKFKFVCGGKLLSFLVLSKTTMDLTKLLSLVSLLRNQKNWC